jgi:Lon protease-like protein
MQLPLFPLHAVLCPGAALPLHIFEERYRLLITRCIERAEPFGVVLIREGRETGPAPGRIADVGTTAIIREAGRYPDGRMNLLTIGGQRFRIESVEEGREPYLVSEVQLLDEPIGDEKAARWLAERVSRRFLDYLELLQPALDDDDGPEIEVEIEVEESDEPAGQASADPGRPSSLAGGGSEEHLAKQPGEAGREERGEQGKVGEESSEEGESASPDAGVPKATDAERHEILMAAARRLAVPDDPIALSYVLGGLVHVELPARQALLEAPDAESRLRQLDALLSREIRLLGRRLKPLVVDSAAAALRRN